MWDRVILLRAQFENWSDAHQCWARELRAPSDSLADSTPADNLTIEIESRLLAGRTTWRTLAHNPELCGRLGFLGFTGGGHAAGINGGHQRRAHAGDDPRSHPPRARPGPGLASDAGA